MENPITDVGVGVVIAILLIREIVPFLLKVANGRNGKTTVCLPRAEFEDHKKVVQYKDNCEQIVKRIDAGLTSLNEGQKDNRARIDGHFREVKDLIRGLPQ